MGQGALAVGFVMSPSLGLGSKNTAHFVPGGLEDTRACIHVHRVALTVGGQRQAGLGQSPLQL